MNIQPSDAITLDICGEVQVIPELAITATSLVVIIVVFSLDNAPVCIQAPLIVQPLVPITVDLNKVLTSLVNSEVDDARKADVDIRLKPTLVPPYILMALLAIDATLTVEVRPDVAEPNITALVELLISPEPVSLIPEYVERLVIVHPVLSPILLLVPPTIRLLSLVIILQDVAVVPVIAQT